MHMFLLMAMLDSAGCIMNIVGKFFLIFFELQFEAKVGAYVRPDIFDEFQCMVELGLILLHVVGDYESG